jgi:hypothetical protein
MQLEVGMFPWRDSDGTDAAITGFRVVADSRFMTARCLVHEILDDCPIKTMRAFFSKKLAIYGCLQVNLHTLHSLFEFY